MKATQLNTDKILWLVYLALLAVLLPHTAWAFSNFEPQRAGVLGIHWGSVTAWAAAFAFEAAIATLTHKLARHIEKTPRYSDWPGRTPPAGCAAREAVVQWAYS